MFFQFWIVWALIGILAATWVFSWALRTRQFENSRRAGLLPLDDIAVEPPLKTHEGRFHFWFIMGILAVGLFLVFYSLHVALSAGPATEIPTAAHGTAAEEG
jgi:hypothetical protein